MISPTNRLYELTWSKTKKYNGRIRKDAINLMNQELTQLAETMIEHAWVETEKHKRKTIRANDMKEAIETTKLNQTPEIINIQIKRLNDLKTEISKNDTRRNTLFNKN